MVLGAGDDDVEVGVEAVVRQVVVTGVWTVGLAGIVEVGQVVVTGVWTVGLAGIVEVGQVGLVSVVGVWMSGPAGADEVREATALGVQVVRRGIERRGEAAVVVVKEGVTAVVVVETSNPRISAKGPGLGHLIGAGKECCLWMCISSSLLLDRATEKAQNSHSTRGPCASLTWRCREPFVRQTLGHR